VAEIDRRASNLGVSRNEYLRRWLDTEIRAEQPVTAEDLRRVSRLARDLADPDVMRRLGRDAAPWLIDKSALVRLGECQEQELWRSA